MRRNWPHMRLLARMGRGLTEEARENGGRFRIVG